MKAKKPRCEHIVCKLYLAQLRLGARLRCDECGKLVRAL